MSRGPERQVRAQYSSWLSKGRWETLLRWFNQNDSKPEHWRMLFEQANTKEFQTYWPHIWGTFEEHLKHKAGDSTFLGTYSGAQERAWKVLTAALPAFAKAVPLLDTEQRAAFLPAFMQTINPWLPGKNDVPAHRSREWMSCTFEVLVGLNGFEQWASLGHALHPDHIAGLVRHTLGKELRWAHVLREGYLNSGGALSQWRVMLLQTDCIDHLQREDVALAVSRALFSLVNNEFDGRYASARTVATPQDAFRVLHLRYPRLRQWVAQASGEDAQVCRAILGFGEIAPPQCATAQSLSIGNSLGLSLKELTALLDQHPVPMQEFSVEGHLFEGMQSPQ